MVVGFDKASNAKVVLLLFDRHGTLSVIVKTGRSPENDAQLRRESDVLTHFWDSGLRSQIPRPLGVFPIAGRLCLAQSALPGRPMTVGYYTPGHVSSRNAVAVDFTAAAAWLDSFHRQSARSPLSVAEWREIEFTPLLELYRHRVGCTAREESLFTLLEDRMTALRDAKVPVTGVHGDYWMGNVLLGGTSTRTSTRTSASARSTAPTVTGVVDWELGTPAGTPTHDVYKFPTSYGFYLDRTRPWGNGKVPGHPGREDPTGRWRSYSAWPNILGFGHTYWGRGWFPELVRSFIRDREAALGIDPALTPILFSCFLMDQAQRAPVPEFRDGYRAALAAFAEERDRTWLWQA
ncbi:MAG: aminoglycoside phosphotransferase family protein [Catenulispora sp.]|nr:aminoglycoside phosphotransferase family protein [Catenulispora sp.]